MKTARFIVAKYAPDLARMEPRNIGVFLWAQGEIVSKFLAVSDAPFVSEQETYARWMEFWNRRIEGDSVRPNRGKPVPKSDPKCMDALLTNQKGNYLLVDAGELLSRVTRHATHPALRQLFNELVATKEPPAPATIQFARQCNNVFRSARVRYKYRQPVRGSIRGLATTVHPDYYMGNGKPFAIAHRATLTNESSVHHAFVTMDAIVSTDFPSNRCRTMYRGSDLVTKEAEQGLRLLEKVCPVLDIESDRAPEVIASIAPLSDHDSDDE